MRILEVDSQARDRSPLIINVSDFRGTTVSCLINPVTIPGIIAAAYTRDIFSHNS